MSDPTNVRSEVEILRRKLLDLTLRNRMLNYRPSKRLGVTIVEESSPELLDLLTDEPKKKLSFVGKPDPVENDTAKGIRLETNPVLDALLEEEAREELDAYLTNPIAPVGQLDNKLHVTDTQTILQTKLRVLEREWRSASEELGVNTLFITLGTLEWTDGGTKSCRAPLLFVPVRLERQANGAIKVMHDGGDVGENLPLRAKMLEFNLQLPEYDDEAPAYKFFGSLETIIKGRAGWEVHQDEICMGLFNYEKYAMYVDLGGENWPEGQKPWDHPDLVAMLGEGYAPVDSSLDDSTFVDSVRTLDQSREIFDADSSQILALIQAAGGNSMIVEGPPGTGKSQTIANMIAEAVASGRKVLFVSAKRAALDVVKRRLDEAGLGDMCLDLHDKLTNRRTFYSELKRTANFAINVKEDERLLTNLAELRKLLNAHSFAVNEPITPYGISPFTAMVHLAHLPKEDTLDREGRLEWARISNWKPSDVQRMMPLVEGLQKRLALTGVPIGNPFWRAEISQFDSSIRMDLETDLAEASKTLRAAAEAIEKAAAALKIPAPTTVDGVHVIVHCLETTRSAPKLQGVAIKHQEWLNRRTEIAEVCEALRTRAKIHSARSSQVTAEAWKADWQSVAHAYAEYGDKWFRSLNGTFRSASNTLKQFLSPTVQQYSSEHSGIAKDLLSYQNAGRLIEERHPHMLELFGVQWRGNDTEPNQLEHLADWILSLESEIVEGRIPAGFLDFLAGSEFSDELKALSDKAQEACAQALQKYQSAAKTLQFPTDGLETTPLDQLLSRIDAWTERLPELPNYIGLQAARQALLKEGFAPVVEVADRWPLATERLAYTVMRSYYTGIVRLAAESRPELRNFERAGHEAAVEAFQQLDDLKLKHNRAAVRLAHQRQVPRFDNAAGNLLALKLQCELTRSHKSIRWIMTRSGEAVQRIKPVFMMSPLSVAIHLPPEMPSFDVVIFDEASQVKPEDALCSIIRAKQTVVVGDTRQMPPTSFFDRITDDEDYDEETESEIGGQAAKLESILNLMSAVTVGRARRPDLRWHYRSLHPALIEPSNRMLYEGRLIVFPSPGQEWAGKKVGLVLHHDPTTEYEAGSKRRINPKEAAQVADAVLRHVRETPEQSLMVAAMNRSQADLIDDEVARRQRIDPAAFEKFARLHPFEPLAVKNLENVQGDERDVVFISVTYGKDHAGVLRQQFGPLLRDGGERRLNVLISRARLRCEVFSNIRSDELRAEPGAIGVSCLKRYLQFAETGSLEVATATGREADSPFEEDVAEALQLAGYEVDLQVGSEGYRIDMAVRDPKLPGRYVLGVECDGATYHSARSARDRDKLRQRVLEARGWKIHRIWSQDWWQDREGEIRRLLDALASEDSSEDPSVDLGVSEPVISEISIPPVLGLKPYWNSPVKLGACSRSDVAEIVQQEGPITHELLLERLRRNCGVGRMNKGIRSTLESAIHQGLSKDMFCRVRDAYVIDAKKPVEPRNWTTCDAGLKSSYVPLVEVEATLYRVIGGSFGIAVDEAVTAAYRLLGFKRITDSMRERGREAVANLRNDSWIVLDDGVLMVAKQPERV
ncbi:MAG: DUF3320 domain-containing protein [Armatimonadetes bacterium]|nr:DUF3320 domain-containing protein [Armatimonadota bacterium]